ncbi:MAG: enoyl-CoA hydratase/isomerase family protein [Actinomycetota bacterium]|nr:enoyl-CoA hydratase/isomerase family protein [Actinomycetota bacterium]
MTSLVVVDSIDDVVVLRMAHGKVNALDVDLLVAVREAVLQAPKESALVLTGNDRAFSAGLDLRQLLDSPMEYSDQLLDELTTTCLTIFDHPRPVVAAVNGAAIAGGAMLALAADVRMMSTGVIGLPELRVGVPIPSALMELARYVLGAHLARHVLQGIVIDPEAALAIGFVDELVEPELLLDRAVAEAQSLCEVPAVTYALMKQALHAEARDLMEAGSPEGDDEVADAWTSPAVRAQIQVQVDRMSKR